MPPALVKRNDLKIKQSPSKRKVQSTEPLKTVKINYGETDQLLQHKDSGKWYKQIL